MVQCTHSSPVVTAALLVFSVFASLAHAQTDDLSKANKAVRMQEFEQAFSLYQTAADAGSADAQYQVGNMLLRGSGTRKDETAAIVWLKKAVSQNHAGAQFTLSQVLRNSPEQANKLLQAAADQGFTPAVNQLKHGSRPAEVGVTNSFEKQWFGAARNNQVSKMEALLSDKTKVNALDSNGRNALFYAAEFNSLQVLPWLIKQGIDLTVKDHLGLTPLQTAVERNHTGIVTQLLAAGSDAKQSLSNGDTLLHYAIRLHHNDLASTLLRAGVPVNQLNKDGWTALDLAKFHKDGALATLLQSYGAVKGEGWPRGRAPQDVAAVSEQLEKNARLAPITMAITNNNKALLTRLVQKNPKLVNEAFENGSTPLVWAARQNKPKMITALLALKADIDRPAYKDYTALQVAVSHGHNEIVSMLLAAGASATVKDVNKKDALITAMSEGRTEISAMLVDHFLGSSGDSKATKSRLKTNNIPVDDYIMRAAQYRADYVLDKLIPYTTQTPAVDELDRNALWFAALHSDQELITKLIKIGVPASQQDNLGQTPMIIAVRQGCLICARNLRTESNLNHKTKTGNTALILAAGNKDTLMTAWLIQNKVDIDARNQRGDTALMAAVNANDLKIAQLLIDSKANMTSKNKMGFSTFDLAEQASPQMVKLLKDNSVLGVF